jgi:hypothetical protein
MHYVRDMLRSKLYGRSGDSDLPIDPVVLKTLKGFVALADRVRVGEHGAVKCRRAAAALVSRSFAGFR